MMKYGETFRARSFFNPYLFDNVSYTIHGYTVSGSMEGWNRQSCILKYSMQIRNEIMHFQIKKSSITSHERIDIQVRHSVMSNKRKNIQIK